MSTPAKSLMAQVNCNGQKMAAVDALQLLYALPPQIPLTTSEAAIFLRLSVTTMERMRKNGGGPQYVQGGSPGAKGTNQSCSYIKQDLLKWQSDHKVDSSMMAAIRKGQTFATLFDLVEPAAFYVDARGTVESMVEENLLGTVVERIGLWDVQWLTPVEAASRRWTDLSKHKEFASGVQSVLSDAVQGVQGGVDSTDIASAALDASPEPVRNI